MASFQFGAPSQTTTQPNTGFTLSQPQQQQAKGFSYVAPASTGGFNFGPSVTTAQSTGFAFGGVPASTSTTPGFSFGTQVAAPSGGGFSFGQPVTTAATSFGFGQPAPTTTTAGSGFLFGAPNTSAGGTSAFGFSNPVAAAAAPAATTSSFGFPFNTAPAASSTFGGFGAPTTTSGSANTFGGFGNASSANTTGGGFSFANTQSNNTSSAFNFSTPKSTAAVITPGFGFGAATTSAAATTVASGTTGTLSSFGTAAAPPFGSAGFTFGTKPAATTAAATSGFAFGSTAATVGTSMFTPGQMTSTSILNPAAPFSQGTTTTPAISAVTTSALGTNLVSASTAPSGFTLNSPSVTSFGTSTQTGGGAAVNFMTSEAAKTAAFAFPLATSTASSAVTGGFGTAAVTTNATVIKPTLSFTVPTTSTAPVAASLPASSQADQIKIPSLTTTAQTSVPSSISSGFSFPSPATPATTTLTTGFSTLGSSSLKAATTTTTSGPSLLATSIPFSAAAGSFGSFGATTSVSLSTTTTVTASSAAGAALTTSTTVTPASAAPPVTMNFRQLEDTINKWKIELEEQERVFLNQATQVNAWDRLLISNGEKITELNEAVERVKLDQQRLDHELDFILAQQRELEELLVPLEKSVESTPNIHHQQHADLEREHTYHLAENIDAQLKRMAEDIKEIIEHLNSSNKTQDDNDPIQQISKILNAHMDALQWVDQNTAVLRRKLDETSKLYESHRRDHEKSFRVGFS